MRHIPFGIRVVHNGHYHRAYDGTWVRESYPIPVLSVKNLCDIEVHFDRISLSTKLRRTVALDFSFAPVAGFPFEAYGVEDYLADLYHPGQSIQDLKENVLACNESELGFSFPLPFDSNGVQVLDLVQLLKREGFYY